MKDLEHTCDSCRNDVVWLTGSYGVDIDDLSEYAMAYGWGLNAETGSFTCPKCMTEKLMRASAARAGKP